MNDQLATAEAPAQRGENITIQTRTGQETVRVREMPIGEFLAYLPKMEDEPRAAEFLCSKPEGWADTIPPGSVGEIIEVGERINAEFFPWLVRRMRRMQRCGTEAKAV